MVLPVIWQIGTDITMEEAFKQYCDILRMVRECGFSAVEVTSLEVDTFGLDHVRAALAETGLKCACLIHMDFFAETDHEKHERIVINAQHKIIAAKELGAKHVMLGLMAQPDAEQHSNEELRESLMRNIRPIAVFGKEQDISVSVEDTPEIRLPLSNSGDLKTVLDSIPELSLTFDTGNMIHGGDDPEHFYQELKGHISYVHLKDMEYTEDYSAGELTADGRFITAAIHGKGIIDFENILRELRQDGYDGWLMLEYVGHENHEENIKAALRYIDVLWRCN
jgi:sugar phosphate isomerase/epimerase